MKLVFVLNGFAVQSVSFILATSQDILPFEILREYLLIPMKIGDEM